MVAGMSEFEVAFAAVIAAARDWATLLFAVLAAGYGWRIDRDRQRDRAVLADGFARSVSEKTLLVEIDIRNRSRRAIRIVRLEVLRPSPSVVAMEGIHEPGPGPIQCRHVVPAESRGALAFLMGSPAQRGRIRIRCIFRPYPGMIALPRRRIIVIDPDALPIEPVRSPAGDRESPSSVDDGVDRNQ